MGRYFPDKPLPQDLTPEEKSRIARKFRRRAKLADGLFLLMVLCLLAGAAFHCREKVAAMVLAVLMLAELLACARAFLRCPCCGRMFSAWSGLDLFFWRDFECPVCGFTPEWSK